MRKLLIVLLLCLVPSATFADELWSYTQRGKKALKNENYEEAYDIFSDGLAVDPDNPAAQYNKALALTHLGRGDEAMKILEGLTFEESKLQSEVAYTEANIYEQAGDAAVQKKDIATAKKAYQGALQKNAESYALNPKNSDARYNLETVGTKLAQLPQDDQKDQNKDDQNKDDKNKDDKNKDKQDKNKDQQNQDKNKNDDSDKNDNQKDQDKQEQQDDQNKDQNKDENKDNKDEDQNKNDQKDQQDKEDQDKDQQNSEDQEKENEQKEEQQPQGQSPEEQQAEQDMQNALQQIMQYADDAKDLNKPPTKKVRPVSNGKEW